MFNIYSDKMKKKLREMYRKQENEGDKTPYEINEQNRERLQFRMQKRGKSENYEKKKIKES